MLTQQVNPICNLSIYLLIYTNGVDPTNSKWNKIINKSNHVLYCMDSHELINL